MLGRGGAWSRENLKCRCQHLQYAGSVEAKLEMPLIL